MQLTAADLREIADTMDKINSAGIDVKVFYSAGHKVLVDKPRNGEPNKKVVLGITDTEFAGTHSRSVNS